jgi:hypothetical protein
LLFSISVITAMLVRVKADVYLCGFDLQFPND